MSGESRPGLLDRLRHQGGSQHQSHAQLMESVRSDLEMLLNTRIHHYGIPASLHHVRRSVVNYGLVDLATCTLNGEQQRRDFAQRLATTIAQFEPRLRNISVSAVTDSPRQRLCFRINAVLAAEFAPEQICFESVLESATASLHVSEVHT